VLGDGNQEKPYLHVSELIDAMVFCYQKTESKINCFNVGVSDSATTVKYMAEAVAKVVSPKATIEYSKGQKGWVGDVVRFSYCTDKINDLGWRPKLSSNQAVDQAIKDILNQR
jgi:UDP-glucose 4-epimerase